MDSCLESYHNIAKIEMSISTYNEEAVIMFGLCAPDEHGEL